MSNDNTVKPPGLSAIEQLWTSGRPLEAGRALTVLVPSAARPQWAGRIVAWAYQRSRRKPEPEVVALIMALVDGIPEEEAKTHRNTIAATLARVEQSGRFDSLHEALLTLALNAAHLLVAAASPASADPKEGWWFVASLKCVGDELDEGFTAEAWKRLRQIA